MSSERMSRVDSAWLRMDSDVNLMMIVGIWLVRPAVGYDAYVERIGEKLTRYPRFLQKVVRDPLGAHWVEDESFDIRRHVTRETLKRRRGQTEEAALRERCGELAATPLDPAHPLWNFRLVEDYDGGSAIIARIHHCIADGIALISVLLSITDGGADPPSLRRNLHAHHEGERDWITESVIKPITELAVKAIEASGEGVVKGVDAIAHPELPLQGSAELLHHAQQALRDAAALALMPDDSKTLLKGRGIGRKVVAWNQPLPLEQVKAVSLGLGCSINDVLLACVAGAIGDYLRGRGEDPTGKGIRAMVPVNLRPLDQAWQLGNRFGLAGLVLPVGIDGPLERVYEVHRRMAELKASYQPMMSYGILTAMGLASKPVQDAVLHLFTNKSTAVMTNVPGPAEPLKFCGSTIERNIFWVPASGNIGVGVSILSYGGGVQFGLMTDEALCPDPQAVIDQFAPEFEKLMWLTLMLPWAGEPDGPPPGLRLVERAAA